MAAGAKLSVGRQTGRCLEISLLIKCGMAKAFATRRAAIYRQRAHELTEAAKQPRDECDRRHMLDQAATFVRAADALAPA